MLKNISEFFKKDLKKTNKKMVLWFAYAGAFASIISANIIRGIKEDPVWFNVAIWQTLYFILLYSGSRLIKHYNHAIKIYKDIVKKDGELISSYAEQLKELKDQYKNERIIKVAEKSPYFQPKKDE